MYGQYAQRVYRFLLGLTGDEGQAEELTQQTFYKAFLHIDTFEGRSSLHTWLCSIGKNEWLRECRKKKPVPLDLTGEVGDGKSVEEDYIRREQREAARRALLELAEPYRDVLILRIYGELPFAEIAAAFEKTESWAKVTFFRGKERLRKEMEGKR